MLSNPNFQKKITSGLISTVQGKLVSKIQGVVDKYKDDACSNPPVFIDRVIADMKASTFFPSPIRMGVEMHRAQIESEMQSMLAEPEFQQACQTADVKKITDEIVNAIKEGGQLGGRRRRRSRRQRKSRRLVSCRRRSRTRRN